MGLFPDTSYSESTLSLEPGDRIVFVTDGMLERAAVKVDSPGPSITPGPCTRARHPALADRVLDAAEPRPQR